MTRVASSLSSPREEFRPLTLFSLLHRTRVKLWKSPPPNSLPQVEKSTQPFSLLRETFSRRLLASHPRFRFVVLRWFSSFSIIQRICASSSWRVGASNMLKWSNHDQVGGILWGEHKVVDDYMVPQSKEHERNSFSKLACSMKQRNEDVNFMSSRVKTSAMKNDFLPFKAKDRSIGNKRQEFNDSSIDMDTWLDLPNLSMTYGGGFNDGNDRDSVVSGLENDLTDASDFKSAGYAMEGFSCSSGLLHEKGTSTLSKPYALLTGEAMLLDGEPELFDDGHTENVRFLDYDLTNIEDFEDLDKMFRNNDSLFGNGSMDYSDAFLTGSKDIISSTSQSLLVPDLSNSGEQSWGKGSSFQQLGEHSGVKFDPLQKEKAYLQNQTPRTQKDIEEKGKGAPLRGLDITSSSKSQQISSPRVQSSTSNSSQTFHSQSFELLSSPHQVVLTDYSFPAYQSPVMPLPPQIHGVRNQHNSATGGFNTNPDCSHHPKLAEASPKPMTMTPQEKIEKLRRRQQMQAMYAIQMQQEQYNNLSGAVDISSQACLQNNEVVNVSRSSVVMEEYIQKPLLSDVNSLEERGHEPSQMLSPSLNGCSIEEGIYYQLQDAMGKFDMSIRLSIRDSLYRLATSAMERQNAGDRSSTNKSNKEEDECSADDESNNQDRLQDSEAVTNLMDRIVAHLLFHKPSGSSLMPIADGNMPMATSVLPS